MFKDKYMDNPQLKLGKKFSSVEFFREANREANIHTRKDLYWAKNDRDKVIVYCKQER